jgi:uncharacterized protein YggE
MKLKSIRNITVASLLIALLGGVGISTPASSAEITRYITLSATGTAIVVPDAVRINATVSVLGTSSKAALATAESTSAAIRRALVVNKIAAKDVASQSISTYPEYTYPINQVPVLSGYRAT